MLFTTLFTASMAALAAASPRKAATPSASCLCKSTDTGSGAYEALVSFCSKGSIDIHSDYASQGVIAGGPMGEAHAYLINKGCPADFGIISGTDCTAAFLDACSSKGNKMGYGTSRWGPNGDGCLYFNIEAK